jgi:quinol monooxygenase YgiN
MYARVTKLSVLPAKMAEFTAAIESLMPALRKQVGFHSALVLRTGEGEREATLISVWNSLQDLRASESNMYYFVVITKLFACCEGYPVMHEEEVMFSEAAPPRAQSA